MQTYVINTCMPGPGQGHLGLHVGLGAESGRRGQLRSIHDASGGRLAEAVHNGGYPKVSH